MLVLQAQALNVSVNGFWLLLLTLIVGAVIGWNTGIRSLISMMLMCTIAYPLFVRGGQEVQNVLNQILVVVPPIVGALTAGSVNLPPPQLNIGFDLGLLVRFLGFLLVGPFIGWLIDSVNLLGWYTPNPGPRVKERYAGATGGLLFFFLLANIAAAFWQDFSIAGGTLPSPLDTTLSILPDTGLVPWILNLIFLVFLFVFNLPKIWMSPPPPKK
jgi:hypothetical protein